jgi:hypothetical protein
LVTAGKRRWRIQDNTSKNEIRSAVLTPRSAMTVLLSVTSLFAYAPFPFFARFLRAISPGTSFRQENYL